MSLSRTVRLTQASSTGYGTGSWTSNSFTPNNNSLLVAVVSVQAENNTEYFDDADLTITDSAGLTWTSRISRYTASGWPNGVRIWTAPVATGQSMTITLDCGTVSMHDYFLCVVEYTGYDSANPVGATAAGDDPDGEGIGSITLSANPAASSEVIATRQTWVNSSGITALEGSGWTELWDYCDDAWQAAQVQVRGGSTSSSVSWQELNDSAGSVNNARMIAVEIRAADSTITPVFACGLECGIGVNSHISQGGGTTPTIDTSIVRSGARSARFNVSSSLSFFALYAYVVNSPHIGRVYIRFASLPSADTGVVTYDVNTNGPNIRFKQSDGKLYAAVGTTFGATGVSITTGQWYRIDYKFVQENAANDVCDGMVDGTALGQATAAGLSSGNLRDSVGIMNSCTADMYADDMIASETAADYPIGGGYVNHFIPTADGTHNIAGTGDFQRGNTGTDILNATTDAYLLVDDVPLPSGTVDQADCWRAVAPANPTTDYVEGIFGPAPGIDTPTVAPRAVEVVLAHHQIATQTGRLHVLLNDNGTTDVVFDTGSAPGVVTYRYARKHYAAGPAGPWVIGGGGNGDFTDLRCRFRAPDAAPDQCLDGIMIEAEFEEQAPSVAAEFLPRRGSFGQDARLRR